MADAIDVEVRGLPELERGMDTLARHVDDEVPKAFGKVADDVASQVKGRVPRATGKLAASVRGETEAKGAIVTMGEGVAYARFVEYGGRGHPPSAQGNYLYPAAMDAQPTLLAAGERTVEHEIGAMHWPRP